MTIEWSKLRQNAVDVDTSTAPKPLLSLPAPEYYERRRIAREETQDFDRTSILGATARAYRPSRSQEK